MPFALGMPALIEMPDLPDLVDLCQELELSFIELNMNMPENCPEWLDPTDLRDVTSSTGIEFTLHSPDELDLGSLHPTVRAGHLDRMREALGWCAQAGVRAMNVHISLGSISRCPTAGYGYTSGTWTSSPICGRHTNISAAASGGTSAPRMSTSTCRSSPSHQWLCFLEHFHLTWDVGHDARSGFREREVMMRHEDRVRHMHLHDYNGRSDHQVPGTGLIDIPAMLDFARRKDIRVLVEVKDERSLRKSVRAVRSLL